MPEMIPEGYDVAQLSNYDKRQKGLYKSQFEHLQPGSYLSRLAGGDEDIFRQMERPALKQFGGLQAGIASKYSGAGMGARRSGAFFNEQNQAATDFAGQLQANRQNLQRQALQDLMGMSNQLLNQRPYERSLVQQQQGPWGDIAGRFAGAIPGAVAGFLQGGPAGAAVGGVSGFASGGSGLSGFNTGSSGGLGSGNPGGVGVGSNTGQFGLPTFLGR